MNALKREFSSATFEVLGFPCNSFYMLEPGATYTEILNGIKYVRPGGGFVPNFQMFKKIDVNGKNEHPLYTYLKSVCGPTSDTFEEGLFYDPKRVSDVRWNYEVFIINKDGKPLYRYNPEHPMAGVTADIRNLLRPGPEAEEDEEEENNNTILQPIVESNEIPVETEYLSVAETAELKEEDTNEVDEAYYL